MRIGSGNMGVDQRGTASFANVGDRFLADSEAFQGIGTVAFGNVQTGKTPGEPRNAAAGGLNFNRNGNGVAIVFDEIKERKLLGTSDVERFPEFALAGGAVTGRDVNDFIWLVVDVFTQRSFARLLQCLLVALVIQSGLRSANGLDKLRAGAGRAADDIPAVVSPMRGHLAPTGAWVIFGTNGLQEGFERGHAEHEAQRPVAVIGVDPVYPGA